MNLTGYYIFFLNVILIALLLKSHNFFNFELKIVIEFTFNII